ncbi:hypothetical protein [Nocardioides daeguensis]|uniref:Uncharacterized protein n=1 Tax=Nocardioides daeguensis TaxID=908359 RepID=A0ABP6V783_9ACTN|nr:hypothetical protein [Nocardioides daeguensis]MBV6726449.1 hypothetical protein [Nocardioides daeguensis]MCR1772292.1 hypothetical protein [Nocardioides daeguensis]
MGDEDYSKDELRQIDTNIERIFYAARHAVPEAAGKLSGAANHLSEALATLNVQAAKTGDPAILRTLLQLGEAIFAELRVGVQSANDFAASLELTGQDYKVTDQGSYDAMAPFVKEMDQGAQAYVPPQLDDRLGAPGATDHVPFVGPVAPGQGGPDVDVQVPSTGGPDGAPSSDADNRRQNELDSESTHNQQERTW